MANDHLQKGFTVWFTGLPSAGKSTLANLVAEELYRRGLSRVELLDGDEVREDLGKGLGFSKEDRDTNILRIGYVAKLLSRNGVIVLTAAISPYRDIRNCVRSEIKNFVEVYVSAPLEVLISRDVKGLYKKALAGEIKNLTGINDPYEEPLSPEIIVRTDQETVETSMQKVLRALELLELISRGDIRPSEQEEGNVVSQLHVAGRLREPTATSISFARGGASSATSHETIQPHGGVLVNRILPAEAQGKLIDNLERFPSLTLTQRQWSDVVLIAHGGYSPLSGFIGERNYRAVVREGRLSNGLAWTIPILLLVHEDEKDRFKIGNDVILRDRDGKNLAVLHLSEIYRVDKDELARSVWQTTDTQHPGIRQLFDEGTIALAGEIDIVRLEYDAIIQRYHRTPAETREYFKKKGWKTIAAFQTRNPVHRAHEYIQKVTLELVDGLLLHPLVGETKQGDIPADVRMECYRVLLENYYPADRVLLSVMPGAMRYAGPREAIHHAIIRQNYGCTHFIVGRDHAGVGSYYGTYDAQRIFDDYTKDELAITPLKFENTSYCKWCASIASERTCPHPQDSRVSLSGTKVREHLELGLPLPAEFSRPEVVEVLLKAFAARPPAQMVVGNEKS